MPRLRRCYYCHYAIMLTLRSRTLLRCCHALVYLRLPLLPPLDADAIDDFAAAMITLRHYYAAITITRICHYYLPPLRRRFAYRHLRRHAALLCHDIDFDAAIRDTPCRCVTLSAMLMPLMHITPCRRCLLHYYAERYATRHTRY